MRNRFPRKNYISTSENISSSNLTDFDISNISTENIMEEEEYSQMLGSFSTCYLYLSAANLSVIVCLVVCLFFITFCLQKKFDGDFIGGKFCWFASLYYTHIFISGLLHAFFIISLCVLLQMLTTDNYVWPLIFYSGFSSFLLWFFHRIIVFPIITLLLPHQALINEFE